MSFVTNGCRLFISNFQQFCRLCRKFPHFDNRKWQILKPFADKRNCFWPIYKVNPCAAAEFSRPNSLSQNTRNLLINCEVKSFQFNYWGSQRFLSTYIMEKNSMKQFVYPEARKDESFTETKHGVVVKDVYRWLEQPDSEETQQFINEQNKVSRPFLEECDARATIRDKLSKLWNYEKYGCPMKRGNFYYFHKNSGLQNQSVLYRQTTFDAEPEVFLDPNTFSKDGTIALTKLSFSEDGRYLAYGLSESGSDWIKIHVKDTETGKDLPDVVEKVKFSSASWTKDNKGFFYGAYLNQEGKVDGSETKQNENHTLYYHLLGQKQKVDQEIIRFPEHPKWSVGGTVSDCGMYLFIVISKDCRDNLLYFAKIKESADKEVDLSNLKFHKIVENFEAEYDYITNKGPIAYFRTNRNASNYRVIAIDLNAYTEDKWKVIIPEHEVDVIDWVQCVDNDKLVVCYIKDVKDTLQLNSLIDGALIHKFPLEIGTIIGISAKHKHSEMFIHFSSFLNPGIIYHYDFNNPKKDYELKVHRQIKLNMTNFDPNNYTVEQKFYHSKDGTRIPMFIVYRKMTKITPRPCLLYGYGGFNYSMQPTFGVTRLTFMDLFNGVLAYPNLRGGGEYGERWHNAGRLLNKQNVFDDFHAAAEYLLQNQYTTKDRLIIQGASNGGLLVAACINQRPDLYGAAIAQVGVFDMLRYNKFTIGQAWSSDYGDPTEREHFENLLRYSPLHNVHTPQSPEEEYPATLIVTADHDDRVSPLHSLKFASALHEAVKDSPYQKKPILLRVYQKSGHGDGKPTAKLIEEFTDILVFMLKTLKIDHLNL